MTQLVNQFAQTVEKGMLDLKFDPNVLACRANATIIAGQAVKLVDVAGGIPDVDVAGDTDEVFGYAVLNMKQASYASGQVLEVALSGSVMYMISGAAFAPGIELMHVLATGKVITAAGTTKYISARAIDKASAADVLVRTYITAFQTLKQPAA